MVLGCICHSNRIKESTSGHVESRNRKFTFPLLRPKTIKSFTTPCSTVFSMPPFVLSSLRATTRAPWLRFRSSGFASSSRVGLHSTPGLFADPPRLGTTFVEPTTTHEAPATEEQKDPPPHSAPAAPPTITPPPSTAPRSASGTPPTATAPKLTLSTPPTPAPAPTTTRKPRKGEPKILRYSPEDTNPTDNSALTHTLTITSSRNNVLLTFTDALGPLFGSITGGSGGTFKKSNRNSYEAANQAAIKMIARIVEYSHAVPRLRMRIAFKGLFGMGREAVSTAIGGPEGIEMRNLIGRVEDRTPYVITGTRARKRRRI